jgi:hypothetical protein
MHYSCDLRSMLTCDAAFGPGSDAGMDSHREYWAGLAKLMSWSELS